MRHILEDAKFTFVPLVDEIYRAQEYLELEKLQFDDRLTYKMEVDSRLKVHQLLMPQMLIQPFLENAVRHGIRSRGYGEIRLIIKDLGNSIRIGIMDDGIGIENMRYMQRETQNSHLKGTGIGIRNTRERLASIRKLYGIDTKLTILDLSYEGTETGTLIELIIPKFDQDPSQEIR